jgi:MarR family transcriptional regulator, organic hydroperoxide resistance regulator
VAVADFVARFTRAAKLMRSAADVAYRRHGVRVGQNLLLEVLWANDGLTPSEVARRLRLATPTVVKMATRMQAAGLLTRRPDESDARLVRLHLTERGRALRGPLEAERRALEERATANLTSDERRQLLAALDKVIENLAGIEEVDETGAETL